LHKPRFLAISKCDLLDEELEQLLTSELPTDIPALFISAVSGKGIESLKDALWDIMDKKPDQD
jgi:GTP-binding protein